MARATLVHQMHDLGLAAWFGGTLANAAAIGVHLVGAAGLVKHDLGRMQAQKGVPTMALAKTGLTLVALGVTGYSRLLGNKVSQLNAAPATDGTLVAIGAYASEQYRPEEVAKGALQRKLG